MKLKKRLTFILIFFLTVAALVSELYIDSYAWDEKEHNSLMEKVLLGENPVYPVDTGKRNEVIRDLRRASYFAIDFTSEERLAGVAKTNKQNEFKELKKGCWRFAAPKNLTDIAVPGGNGTGRNGDHRKYTHMGWDYDYTDKYNGWEAEQWELRKNILLSTVHKKLDFGVFSSRNNTQCVAFCELLYYTHILGDDISDFEKNAYIEYHLPDDTMWFAGKKESTQDSTDITSELLEIMPDLFSNHENDKAANSCYYKLKLELERIDEEAYSIINSEMDENNDGGLTQKGYEELYGLAEDMKKAMTDNIPTLLRAEKFFSSCFYDD